jgi:hypothetical protein
MNRQEIEHQLEEMRFGNLAVPSGHKQRLKAALVDHATRHKPSAFLWLREAITYMRANFKTSSFVVGALVGVLIVAGAQTANNSPLLAKYNPLASKTAKAQAEVKNMMFKTKQLNPEERANIEKKIQGDMEGSLQEAYAAKDLIIVEGDQMQDMGITTFKGSDGAQNASFMAVKGSGDTKGAGSVMVSRDAEKIVKQLRYTDPKGRKVTLGISENGVPVFKMMTLSEQEMLQIRQKMEADGGNEKFHIEAGTVPAGTPSIPADPAQ